MAQPAALVDAEWLAEWIETIGRERIGRRMAGFFADLPRTLEDLARADTADLREAERLSHALKGSAGLLGLSALAAQFQGLEERYRAGERGASGERLALIGTLATRSRIEAEALIADI